MPRARLLLALAVLAIFVFASVRAQVSLPAIGGQADSPKSEEYFLLGSPNRGAGEPIIFVNPADSKNMIVVAMATLNRLPTGEAPILRGNPGATELRVKELSTPDGSRTDIAVTLDGGKTWKISEDNFRKIYNKNRCSDSFAGAGHDGTLYMGCLAYLNRGDADFDLGYAPNGEPRNMHGGSAIAWSKDKGLTWSNPVWVHPAQSPSLYAPTVKPVFEQASPWDRPFFVEDASTGTIYVSGSGPAYTVDPSTVPRPKVDPSLPGKGYTGYPPSNVTRGRTFIRASHDRGKTWGIIYPMDNDEYPGGRGGFSAAHGKLVVAYNASKVPASLNAQCPCTVLGTSRDDGKTFEYSLIPALPAAAAQPGAPPEAAAAGRQGRAAGPGPGGGIGGGLMLAADPTKEGRYAIARQSGQTLMISITEDGGKTWLPPVLAAQVSSGAYFGHRAMKYSDKGVLGLIWKATYPDRSFDVWSSVSKDNGRTFKIIRISHAVSPPYVIERGNFMFGDDLSSLDVDAENLHVVWGDNRTGFQGTWYGRVPLSAYDSVPAAGASFGRGGRGMGGPSSALLSPEVKPDRTVTLRFRAPEATQVQLVGEITLGKGPLPMTRDESGIWTITVGPLAPEVYVYNFRVQGVDVTDPSNFNYKPTSPGLAMSSFAEVPGESPAFYDSRPVPHGEVRMVMYESKAMGVTRYMWIYTPPNYDRSTERYPVFYLLHGNGEAQDGWVMNGRANVILDNLIADKKAQPMVLVMPHGHAIQSAGVGPIVRVPQGAGGFMNFDLFTRDLLEQIIPTVEKNYRVYADADHRAIGGLSMGGMQAIAIGLSHLHLFHYVLGYSGGFGAMGPNASQGDPTGQSPWKELLANAAETRTKLHLLFLGCGRQEPMIGAGQQLVKAFKESGINAQWADHDGGHVWSVWRNHLNESVPMLFASGRR